MSVEARAEYLGARQRYDTLLAGKVEMERELERARIAVEFAWSAAIKEADAEVAEHAHKKDPERAAFDKCELCGNELPPVRPRARGLDLCDECKQDGKNGAD